MKNQENTETRILKLFGGNTDKQFTFDKLKELLPKSVRKEKLVHALMVLKKQKRIIESEMDVYKLNEPKAIEKKLPKAKSESKYIQEPSLKEKAKKPKASEDIRTGVLDITQSGASFVIIEGIERDAIIRGYDIPAISGDIIEVRLSKVREGKRPEAQFIRVVERKQSKFIGKFRTQKSKEFDVYFVEPLSIKVPFDFYIASKHVLSAKDGDYVEVQLTEWKEKEKNPRGQVVQVLEKFNPNELEMRSILLNNGFSEEFDPEVTDELKSISHKILKKEIESRLDLREILTLTIDPKTARDFDDALSIEKLEDDKYEIGVHIADVSYYVQSETAVDQEAIKRATSVYLPDRVAPMLPEILSNDLCSLNPKVDRLAFSVMYTIDTHGVVHDEYLAKTVIHSDHRFAYEDAQAIIESKKGKYSKEVLLLWTIASKWKEERTARGAINFESPEVQFVLDENQVPIAVIPKVQKEANWLIEEFMLRANVTVAKALDGYTKAKKIPAGIYRNHDSPDMARLEQFRETAMLLGGHKVRKAKKPEDVAKILNEFLSSIADQPESDILNQMAIRTMAKAHYSTENIGHYGLGYTHYSHFTSPIRRYPDLIAHRLLTSVMKKEKSTYTAEQIEELCVHCSSQERKASDCEREGIKYKQMEYMSTRTGQYYSGIISGLNGNGFWVELSDNKCEGYVELNKNFKESFQFDAEKLQLKSTQSQIEFHMGMPIEIRIDKVELATKKAWFSIVNY